MDPIQSCRECRAQVQRGSRFCSACGHPLFLTTVEGERRQLTVLFCDMVGSTALSERLDPEDLSDLLHGYQRVCRDAILRHGGHISQFLGDGVLAYFGYPIAHEDDAVRAVRSALAILEAVKLVNQGIGKRVHAEIHVRAGLDSGVAVIGESGPQERLAIGEPVNLAARIEAFADADVVLLSAATARLVGGHFELQTLTPQTLKGFSRPIELFRVGSPTGARTKFEAAALGRLTPHVGREAELAQLKADWGKVQDGADRVVVVRGEAGIGKSRLVHHFRHAELDEAVFVLESFCSPLTQGTALAPIIEMINARILQRAEGDVTPQAKLEALASLLGEHSCFGPDALPLIAALVSISGADEAPLQDLSPVRRRTRTLETLRAWIASSAERVPLALLVEDAHWADPSTLDFLDLLVREPPGGRTFLCLTARPEFLVRWEQRHVRSIELSRLTPHEVETLVTHVAGGHALPALVAKRITERSEGVPLFAEEVTKAVLESGAVRLDANRYELARAFDEKWLPSTVQGWLVARFDRLGESRRVAQLGAAIGREFSYALIRAVANLTDEELRGHLDRLCRSELAFVQGDVPNAVYTFKHAIIQDTIYATLLKRERVGVHQRIFDALIERFPEVVVARPEMAAHHAENAGRRDTAVPLLRDAGLRALQRTQMIEAVQHLRHGIELVDALPEPARTSMELELQAAIGPAYMATLGWGAPEVERSSARLRDIASASGDNARLFLAIWGLWTVYFLRGQLDPALELAEQALAMANAAGDPLLRVAGHHAVGYTHFFRAEYEPALRHSEAGLALFSLEREKQLVALFQFSSSCAMWRYRAATQQLLGLTREGSESLRALRNLVDELRHGPSTAYALGMQCFLFHAQDDVAEVQRLATATRALSLAEGFELWTAVANVFLAWSSARQGGSAPEAVDQVKAAKDAYHGTLTHITELELTGVVAETLLLANRPDEVAPLIEAALRISQPGRVGHYESELFRIQGDAARATGDRDGAVTFYQNAVECARDRGAKTLETRAKVALEGGDIEAATAMLRLRP